MRTMVWSKEAKDLDRSQDELPNNLISRSGRIRKVKDTSGYYFGTSIANSDKVTTVTATATNLENSKKVETESVAMEAEVSPMETLEKTPKPEPVKDNKARVNADLLQKVLSESVEEWFSLAEVIKSNKGKPYKKRKILLPPMDESDFCFELTQTKDTVKKPEDEDGINSTSNKEPEIRHSEASKKEDGALEINKNDKVSNTVINKKHQTTIKSASFRSVGENVTKEDKCVEKKDSATMTGSLKTDGVSKNEKGKITENGKNKRFRNFFALIIYGDETNVETKPDMMTADSKQKNSSQQTKTVIKTLNLETADLKEFELELGDFSKFPKDSPIFECVSGIERLLQTGTAGSTLQESLSGDSLDGFPKSIKEGTKRKAEMSTASPSRQKKMNLKARERLYVLSKDIMEKYKRKAEGRVEKEVQTVKENTCEEEKADEKKKGHIEEAEKFRKTDSEEIIVGKVDKAEPKKKPKTNRNVHENGKKEEVNGPIEEKVETGLEKPEMKEITNKTCAKTTKLTTDKRMDNEKDNKMSAMRYKKRKQLGQARTRVKLEKLFSYVNTMKRKSGYKSSSESTESLNCSVEEPAPKGFESNQEARVEETDVEETKERRKSQREIKLTPKLVHMIATSHKRAKRSPSVREDSVEEKRYEYPNLLKKVVSKTVTPEVVESSPSSSATENCIQFKMEANASDLECNWQPGDLVWARFAGSPFWPSLVLRDPFSNDEYTKVKHLGRLLKPFVHLQFLADSGRRAWVPQHYCMSFNGLNEFEKIKSNLPKIDSFTQRNDLMYQKAFFPKKQKELAWLVAVKEGETVLRKSKEERINYMKAKYPLVKYAPSVTNGQPQELETVCNGTASEETTSGEVINHSYGTRFRKARSSSGMEPLDCPKCDKATTEKEASTRTGETFECVRPGDAKDNTNGDEKEAPKITLKLVRSPKKNEKREWSNSSEGIEGPLLKRPKRNVPVSFDSMAELTPRSQKKVGGRKEEEVCEVCLRMLGRRNIIKCNGVCSGVTPRGSRKRLGVKVDRLEEGAAPALKKRQRRRKFSSPREKKATGKASRVSGAASANKK